MYYKFLYNSCNFFVYQKANFNNPKNAQTKPISYLLSLYQKSDQKHVLFVKAEKRMDLLVIDWVSFLFNFQIVKVIFFPL